MKECRFKFDRINHIVDSEIVRAMIQRESYGFNTFTSTKIGEIQNGSDVKEWFWIKGSQNIADLLTRGGSPGDVNMESEWQNGPLFMKGPISEWPISQDCSADVLPEIKSKNLLINCNEDKPLICLERFSDYYKLLRVTSRLLSLKAKPFSLKHIGEPIRIENL